MGFKHLTNPHHRKTLKQSVRYFDVLERHHTARELIDQCLSLRWSSPRADALTAELRQSLGHVDNKSAVTNLRDYRATRIQLNTTRLRDELRVLRAAEYIAEIVKSMRNDQTLEAVLPSGKAGVRIHYKNGGALVGFIPDYDSIPTYTDYVRDNYYRAEVGGIAPDLLKRHYSKPFLDVVRKLLSHGLQQELEFFAQ
jgi:hypothetical protein